MNPLTHRVSSSTPVRASSAPRRAVPAFPEAQSSLGGTVVARGSRGPTAWPKGVLRKHCHRLAEKRPGVVAFFGGQCMHVFVHIYI